MQSVECNFPKTLLPINHDNALSFVYFDAYLVSTRKIPLYIILCLPIHHLFIHLLHTYIILSTNTYTLFKSYIQQKDRLSFKTGHQFGLGCFLIKEPQSAYTQHDDMHQAKVKCINEQAALLYPQTGTLVDIN